MSLYDIAKDAAKLAQKADNIELVQKLLDVQQKALEMQEKHQELLAEVQKLKGRIASLSESKKFVFVDGENYLIDSEHPERHLCPHCTRKLGFEVPLNGYDYCVKCRDDYSQ